MTRHPVSPRRRTRQKGSALFELALCFMGFLLLMMGTMDFGYAVYAYNFCTYAARDASRWTTTHGANSATSSSCSDNPGIAYGCAANSSDVASYVSGRAIALDTSKLTVTTTWTPDTTPGSEVNVTVKYSFAPLSGIAIKNTISMSSSSQMEMVH
jgi:Flp pilus assembly protein TadG